MTIPLDAARAPVILSGPRVRGVVFAYDLGVVGTRLSV